MCKITKLNTRRGDLCLYPSNASIIQATCMMLMKHTVNASSVNNDMDVHVDVKYVPSPKPFEKLKHS